MGGDKTFVFTPEAGASGGGLNSILAMIPGMLKGNGLDPNLVAALMNGNKNQDAWGGGGCWWIWIIVLFWLWGSWGGNGFGGNRNGGGLPAELNNDAGRELLMSAIQGNGTAINQLASSLNCSTQQLQSALCNVQGAIDKIGGQIGMSSQQIINSVQSMGATIGQQIASCCCDVRTAIERQGAETRLQNCQDMNVLTNTMNQNTMSLRDGNLANTQAILSNLNDFKALYQADKMDRLTAENLALKGQISQANQNAYIAATIQANTAPILNRVNDLQSDVDGIKCKMPPTVAVPYPQLQAFNPECFRAAAFGAYAGDAAYCLSTYNNGCGC